VNCRSVVGIVVLFAVVALAPSAAGRTDQRGAALAPGAIDPALAGKRVIVGSGYVENTARQVIRTADDRVYIFAADDTGHRLGTGPGIVRAWKASTTGIPTDFSEVDAANHPVAAGGTGNVIVSVDVRLDRSGIAQVIYVDETNGNLFYRTFSTLTDTWGSASVIATGVYHNFYLIKRSRNSAAMTLDSADNLHVVYDSGTTLSYINRVSGTWSAPVTIATSSDLTHPMIACDAANNLYVSYLDNAVPAVKFVKRPAGSAWLSPETVDASETQTNDTGDQGPSLVVTQSGRPYILWISPGPSVFIRIKYRSATGWVSDNPATNLYSHAPQIWAQNDDVYAFLGHDDHIRFGYDYHLAGQPWAPYASLTSTTDGTLDGSADVRWDPPRDNNPGVIDAAFFDENKNDDSQYIAQLYYMAVLPAGAAPPPPGGDVNAPSVSITSPAGGSTVSGTVGLSASASDDVGVAGVQFRVDGVNVGVEVTSSPYAYSWDSTSAANGSHVLSAVARDAAGNVGSSSVSVTVSNAAPPAPPGPAVPGLVAGWGFNEGTGMSAADASGKGHAGTVSSTSWSSAGRFGGALSFNGSSSWVTVADANDLDSTSALTLEAWVRPTALGTAWRTVVFKERSGGMVYSLYANQDTGRPVGQLWLTSERNAVGSAGLALNAWSHLASTYDGSNLRLYVNGALVSTTPVSGSLAASTGVLRIGGNGVWPEWFAGLIDEVRVYNRALSASEIQSDMNTAVGTTADTSPPSAPANLRANSSTGTINLLWDAATDNVGVARYDVYRSTSSGFVPSSTNLIGQSTGTSYSDFAMRPGTYYYVLKAVDAAGNNSAASNQATGVCPDTTPPGVTMSSPAGASTVSGTVAVSANASDDVGVVGVQFRVDGANAGAEIMASPYTVSWDSRTVTDGSHVLSAVARDAAGNTSTASVSVTVSNAAPPPPPPPPPAASGLVAAWGFNEGAGMTVADASGKGHAGTVTSTAWNTTGRFGKALSFNGSSSWVTVADANDLDLTSALTLEAWVRPSALGSVWRTVLFKERAGGIVYSLYANQDTGRPVGQLWLGSERDALGSASLALNAWSHLASTYDGSNLRLYVNGALVSTTAVSGSLAASTGVLRVGGNGVWPEWFAGSIDEVRVYNRALSAGEIQSDMNTAVG
jgi:hypothetical protein